MRLHALSLKNNMRYLFVPAALIGVLLSPGTQAMDVLSVYQQAVGSDPSLRTAQLQTEVSEAQRGQAGGALLPQINANINLSLNQQSSVLGTGDYNGQSYTVGLTQSIIDVAKLLNWQRYKTTVDQYQASQEDAQQELMYKVIERYFKILEASDSLILIQQERQSTASQLEQARKQFQKQRIKITDVYELEAKQDLLSAEEIGAQAQLDSAQQQLFELTGESVIVDYRLQSALNLERLEGEIEDWVTQALAMHPGLVAQTHAVKAAEEQVWQQHAQHLPVVEGQLNYYNTNTGFQNAQRPVIDTQVAALNIRIPLFSGGSTMQAANEASRQLDIAKQQQIALQRTVSMETRDAFLNCNAGSHRIHATEKALLSSLKAREAMEKGFAYGMHTVGDVLISQDREFRAQRDLLVAKYTYIKYYARFARATGVLNEAFLNGINEWLVSRP